ncbi:hypothetical protein GCM10009716_26550 [Streptomyces sodiiphilus]|uniref:Uncharacterized protein n=1 Tax=Streptomyces sodiiphilus TaxID=226217 RepID=A0ABP5AJU4_9ACTN
MRTTIDRRAPGPRAFRPLLQPSFFCVRRPVTLASPELMPVLVHPVEHTLGWASEPGAASGCCTPSPPKD